MTEPHPDPELGQAGPDRGPRRLNGDAQPCGRPPHQRRIAGRIGRRQLQQPPGLDRQRVKLARQPARTLSGVWQAADWPVALCTGGYENGPARRSL
jgi:hypothetical protein